MKRFSAIMMRSLEGQNPVPWRRYVLWKGTSFVLVSDQVHRASVLVRIACLVSYARHDLHAFGEVIWLEPSIFCQRIGISL